MLTLFRNSGVLVTLLLALCLIMSGCAKSETTSEQTNDSTTNSDSTATGELVDPIRFVIPSTNWKLGQNQASLQMVNNWKQLGFQVEAITTPNWGGFFGYVSDDTKWDVASGGYQASMERLDPDYVMRPILYSQYANAGGSNIPNYKSEEFDQLLDKASQTFDLEERKKLTNQAVAVLSQDLPYAVLYAPNIVELHNKELKNLVTVVGKGLYNVFSLIEGTGKDEFVLGWLNQDETQPINPTETNNGEQVEFLKFLYDTVATIGPEGTPMPWLAESWEIDENDPTKWTIKIKTDVKFSDGSELTAADVKFSYDYFKQHETPAFLSALNRVEEVTITGNDTLEFKTTDLIAAFPGTVLAVIPILPQKVWEPIDSPTEIQAANLLGSGPFVMVNVLPGQSFSLIRNEHYRMPVHFEKFTIRSYGSQEALFLAMNKGEIDLTDNGFDSVYLEQIDENQVAYQITPTIRTSWLAFNMTNGIMVDHTLRLAALQAVDKEGIVRDIFDGYALIGTGPIPQANEFWYEDTGGWPEFDMDQARKTLEDGGYGWDSQGRLIKLQD